MVLGTGTARLMCAVPSPSMIVRSSSAGVWACARQVHIAGKMNNDDARVRLVILVIKSPPRQQHVYQNTTLRLICNSRMSTPVLVLVIWPKLPVPGMGTPFASSRSAVTLLLGSPKLGWLKTLKASSRNCKYCRSVNLKSLLTEASTVNNGGPITTFRPKFPKVYSGCRAKACVLNHSFGVVLLSFHVWPGTTFGRSWPTPVLD